MDGFFRGIGGGGREEGEEGTPCCLRKGLFFTPLPLLVLPLLVDSTLLVTNLLVGVEGVDGVELTTTGVDSEVIVENFLVGGGGLWNEVSIVEVVVLLLEMVGGTVGGLDADLLGTVGGLNTGESVDDVVVDEELFGVEEPFELFGGMK